MAFGPGKYDAELAGALASARRKHRGITGGVLIVHSPVAEVSGFAAQLTAEALVALPSVLRQVADQIDADRAKIGGVA